MSGKSTPHTPQQLSALLPEVTGRLLELVGVAESLADYPELVLPDESGKPRVDDPEVVRRCVRQQAVWAHGIGQNIGQGHVRQALHSLRILLTNAAVKVSDRIAETGHVNAHAAAWSYVTEVWIRAAGAVHDAKCRAIRRTVIGKRIRREVEPNPYPSITLEEWERHYEHAARALCHGPGRPPPHLVAWVRQEYVIARDLLHEELARERTGKGCDGRPPDKLKPKIIRAVRRERSKTPPTPWNDIPAIVAARFGGRKLAVGTLKGYLKPPRKA